jgi:hypothetical protein
VHWLPGTLHSPTHHRCSHHAAHTGRAGELKRRGEMRTTRPPQRWSRKLCRHCHHRWQLTNPSTQYSLLPTSHRASCVLSSAHTLLWHLQTPKPYLALLDHARAERPRTRPFTHASTSGANALLISLCSTCCMACGRHATGAHLDSHAAFTATSSAASGLCERSRLEE